MADVTGMRLSAKSRAYIGSRISPAVMAAALVFLNLVTLPLLHAGAWAPPGAHGQVILTTSLYRTGSQFDQPGNVTSFGYGGDYRQFITSAYIECKVGGRNTLIVNAPVELLEFKNNYGKQTDAGMGDIEIAWKRQFNSTKSLWAISGQLLTMFPAYSANENPAPGNHQEDIEGRFMVGHGSPVGGSHFFWDAEAAYRYRAGPPADQFRSDVTVGIEFPHGLMVMGQAFATKGMRNGSPITPNQNPNAQSDYDLYKVQPSLVLSLSHGTRLQAGWNDAFVGRNTGNGQTVLLGIWKTF